MLKRLFPYLFLSGAVIAAAVVLILLIQEKDKTPAESSPRQPQSERIVFSEAEINSIVTSALAGQQNVSNAVVDLKPGLAGNVTFTAVVLGRSFPGTARAGIRTDSQWVYVDLSDVKVAGQSMAAPDTSAATQELNRLIQARAGGSYTIQSAETTETELMIMVMW